MNLTGGAIAGRVLVEVRLAPGGTAVATLDWRADGYDQNRDYPLSYEGLPARDPLRRGRYTLSIYAPLVRAPGGPGPIAKAPASVE
jgi:hypothetical protein